MSRLEELIQELCPNGVEFFTVKELTKKKIIKTITPSIKIKRNDYQEYGITPIISQELEYISGYCDFFDDSIPENNYVCFGDHSEHIKFVDFAFVQGADGLKIMSLDEEKVMAKFFYYAISSFYVRHNNYERHFKYLNDTEIPVPPLEVQCEIVHILDSFTLLTAELTAELTARKKQYEYYRNELLENLCAKGVEYKTIQEVCVNICSGGTPKTSISEYYGGDIPWVRTQEVDWNYIYDTDVKITEEGLANSSAKWIPENCIIVAMYGATAAKVAINKIPVTTNQACCNLEINENIVLIRYVYHFLCNEYENLKGMGQGSQSNINAQMIKNYRLPVPLLEVQREIVDILDRFDSLCNDISTGLPAEIEARQKQYEFYRDKLLSFKQL